MDSTNVTSGGPGSPDGDVWVKAQSTPTFTYEASGGIGVSGPVNYREDIDYEGTGGVTTGGVADVLLGVYSYTGTGGVVLGGILYAIDFCYEASGGITIGGSQPSNSFAHVASGGVVTSGQATFNVPYWEATMTGGVQVVEQTSASTFYTVNGRNYYVYFSFGSSGISLGGQAAVVTSAPPDYQHTMTGGMDLSGVSVYSTSGLPGGQFPYTSGGGVGLTGSAAASVDVVPRYVGRGGPQVGGEALCVAGYAYTGNGVVYLGGYGDTPASGFVIIDQQFEWNVNSEVTIDQQFQWQFGDQILYWWQVESCCEPLICERSVVTADNCHNTKFLTTILAPNIGSVCEQLTAKGINSRICNISQFSRAALTTDQAKLTSIGVDQVCNKMVPVSFCDIPQCLDFCVDYHVNLTFGVMFATDQRYEGSGGVTISGSADSGYMMGSGVTTGGVGVGGSADVSSSANTVIPGVGTGTGVSGAALVESSAWQYRMIGGAGVGGSAIVMTSGTAYPQGDSFAPAIGACFPDWLTELSLIDKFGTLVLERIPGEDVFMGCRQMTLNTFDASNTPVSAPMRFYFFCGPDDATWKLQITYPSQSAYQPGAVGGYTCDTFDSAAFIWGATPPGEDAFIVGSNSGFPVDTQFFFPCDNCYGRNTSVVESYYQAYGISYEQANDPGVRVLQTQSSPGVIPGGFAVGGGADALFLLNFTSGGFGQDGPNFSAVTTGGSALCSQSYPAWDYAGSGGVSVEGAASLNRFAESGSGGISLGGGSDTALGQWSWTNNQYDAIQTGGAADCSLSPSALGIRALSLPQDTTASVDVGFFDAITYSQVEFNRQDITETIDPNIPVLEPVTDTIKTNCDCNAIAEVIQMRHNLGSTGKLQEFLFRNNLDIPSVLSMSYNKVYRSWQTNLHLSGVGADGVSPEDWNIVFSWQCTSLLGGTDQGSPLWVYGMYAKARFGNDTFDSRVILAFSQLGPCQETSTIRFTFDTNTSTGETTTDPKHSAYDSQVHDSIGLFRSLSWLSRPVYSVVISMVDTSAPVTRVAYDYNPIFPDT